MSTAAHHDGHGHSAASANPCDPSPAELHKPHNDPVSTPPQDAKYFTPEGRYHNWEWYDQTGWEGVWWKFLLGFGWGWNLLGFKDMGIYMAHIDDEDYVKEGREWFKREVERFNAQENARQKRSEDVAALRAKLLADGKTEHVQALDEDEAERREPDF